MEILHSKSAIETRAISTSHVSPDGSHIHDSMTDGWTAEDTVPTSAAALNDGGPFQTYIQATPTDPIDQKLRENWLKSLVDQ